MKKGEKMEGELNRIMREILEMFEVNHEEKKGEYTLLGHLSLSVHKYIEKDSLLTFKLGRMRGLNDAQLAIEKEKDEIAKSWKAEAENRKAQ